jgi:hypothetical protein
VASLLKQREEKEGGAGGSVRLELRERKGGRVERDSDLSHTTHGRGGERRSTVAGPSWQWGRVVGAEAGLERKKTGWAQYEQ